MFYDPLIVERFVKYLQPGNNGGGNKMEETPKTFKIKKLIDILLRLLADGGDNPDAKVNIEMATSVFQKVLRVLAFLSGTRSREIDPDAETLAAELMAEDLPSTPTKAKKSFIKSSDSGK